MIRLPCNWILQRSDAYATDQTSQSQLKSSSAPSLACSSPFRPFPLLAADAWPISIRASKAGYPRVYYSVHVRTAAVTLMQMIVLVTPVFLLKLHIRQSVDYINLSNEAMHMRMKSSNQSQLKSSSPPSLAFPLSFRPSPVLGIGA
jgi:hypothetical protein